VSCVVLQLSSGIFTHLKETVMSAIRQEPTPDLQPETLSTLSAMMLAQAQDCFCRKAMAGRWSCHVYSIRRITEE